MVHVSGPRTYLVQGKLFNGFDGIVRGQQEAQQLVRGRLLGNHQTLVLRRGLQCGGVHTNKATGLHLQTEPEERKGRTGIVNKVSVIYCVLWFTHLESPLGWQAWSRAGRASSSNFNSVLTPAFRIITSMDR